MKKLVVFVCITTLLALAAGSAMAEDIAGKFGVTGRLGFLVPADSEFNAGGPAFNASTDVGFVGGGGFIYGINRNFAAELDITHTSFDASVGGFKEGEFSTTNIALGGQYRFDIAQKQLTPYAGAGLDILINDFNDVGGIKADVDTTVGIHLSGGLDYFVMKQLAITGEVKLLLAPDADINFQGTKVGNYDPMSLSTTVGVRYFFN